MMDPELIRLYGRYRQTIKDRREKLEKLRKQFGIKTINIDSINDDLNYIAKELLIQQEFKFKKDRTTDKARLMIGERDEKLRRADWHSPSFFVVHFIDGWNMDVLDSDVLNILPEEFVEMVQKIAKSLKDYNELKKGIDSSYPKKSINVPVSWIGDYSGVCNNTQTELCYDDIESPEDYIENDKYWNALLEFLDTKIIPFFKDINDEYTQTIKNVKALMAKYTPILAAREL